MARIDPDGYAVRLDWPAPEPGTVQHEFTQFTRSLQRAMRRAASTRRFWSRGPLRPLAVTVVPIGWEVYRAHMHDCGSQRCPTAAPLLGLTPDAPSLPASR
jgi:hypothetical protein